MIKKSRLAIIIILVVGCSGVSENTPAPDVLAEINGLSISAERFQNAFKEYYYRTGQVLAPTQETRQTILASEFNTYVLAVHAEDLGISDQRESLLHKEAIKRRVITEEYFNQVILQELEVTEQDLQDYFLRFNSRLRASHIYSNSKEEIEAYAARLNNGASFNDLAQEAFQNEYLANNGGDIGWFTTDELDVAFEETAYNLNVGEISEPVQTAQGFSIIKLTDASVVPILTEYQFNQNREQLESYVYKKKTELLKRNHLTEFVGAVEFDMNVIENLWDRFDSNYEAMLQKNPEFISQLQDIEGTILFSNGFDFTTASMLEEYMASPSSYLFTIQDGKSFKDFFIGLAYRSYMLKEAEENGIHQQKIVQDDIDETYYHYLADRVIDHLEASIINTPAELYSTYQEERENFYDPLQVNLQRIVLGTEEEANEVLAMANSGANFTSLVNEFTINNEDRFLKGEQGFQSIKNFGFNSSKISELGIGEISEIIAYTNQEYHIYKMLDRQEDKLLSFAEAQPMVDDFLTKKKLQQLQAETIEQVKQKHNAVVDLEKLNELIIQI